MKHIISFVIFFGLLGISGVSFSQNYYAVHFKYKPQDTYRLDQPAAFLSSKSLDRKARFNIAVDSLDLPVSERYMTEIKDFFISNLYNSNWLNAAIILADPENIPLISALPYVEKVVYVKPGSHVSGRIVSKTDKFQDIEYQILPANRTVSYEPQNEMLGIDKMLSRYRGRDITIAVFDAGFIGVNTMRAFNRIYDLNKVIATRNFVKLDDESVYTGHQHGTNVLSLMAAYNLPQIISGAFEANYILCMTEDVRSEFKIEEYNWVKAAEYSDSLGVDIINSSLGYLDFDDPHMDYSLEDLDGETAIVTQGANIAANKGILVVNSAGNYGRRGASSIVAPADAKGILSIGGVNIEKERASFSSQGPTADGRIKPELAALGQSVFVLGPDGQGYLSQGTSFAAPQIAALAAGLWEAKPEWNKDELIAKLLASATQADDPDNLLGHGVPSFIKAYFGEILSIPSSREPVEWSLYPNPIIGEELFIRYGNETEAIFKLLDISGREISQFDITRASVGDPFRIQLPQLRAGVYVVEIRTAEGMKRVRVIKR